MSTSVARADEPRQLRVLSYNIHHAEGVDGKLDLPRIADVILSVQPDLVALQEVDRNVGRTGEVDQPAELARLTGMEVAFGANIELQGGEYGNAVLSRFPIVAQRNHLLPRTGESEQRGVLEAEIAVPGWDERLRLLATHFDHRRDETERLASARMVTELTARRPNQPALLAGDLNDTPESATLQRLGSHWTVANDQPRFTIPVDRPTRQIDFVLIRPADRWKVIEVRVLEESVASDHRPILAVVQWRGGA